MNIIAWQDVFVSGVKVVIISEDTTSQVRVLASIKEMTDSEYYLGKTYLCIVSDQHKMIDELLGKWPVDILMYVDISYDFLVYI